MKTTKELIEELIAPYKDNPILYYNLHERFKDVAQSARAERNKEILGKLTKLSKANTWRELNADYKDGINDALATVKQLLTPKEI